MNKIEAKNILDKIINKARVHLYKPIQIAEILYRDRVFGDINLIELETYRNSSKKWRDAVCLPLLGRVSTSSARYQDDIFNENALPPSILSILGAINREQKGSVEAYIYSRFADRFSQMSSAIAYCENSDKDNFDLSTFLSLFWQEAGLRRSIDKVYEIVVFALFSAIVSELDMTVEVSINPEKRSILAEFEDFSQKILNLDTSATKFRTKANIFRVGVTNAADRGLDMWANFGLAIQIKHLSLNEEMAENIVETVSADRIVIVCKAIEQKVILSLLTQIGWKARVQSIVTEDDLSEWYYKALKGNYGNSIGNSILKILKAEIEKEFPATNKAIFNKFFEERNYIYGVSDF